LQVATQGLGLMLGPISGSITVYFAIETPFYVSCGAAIFGVFWVLAFLPRGTKKELVPAEAKATPVEAAPGPTRNPYCDITVMFFAFASICMATLFIGTMGLLVPQMLLRTPGFGFSDIEDPEERSTRLAQALGLLSLPNGLASTFTTIFLYTALTERFGDISCLAVAGLIMTCTWPWYGQVSAMWQLYICHGVVGASMGMIFPSIGPLMAKYAVAAYPEKKAQVQAIPMMGMSVGMTIGQNIMAVIMDSVGINNGFYASSMFTFAGVSLMVMGMRRVNAAIDTINKAKKFEDAIGDDPIAFAGRAGKLVTEYLIKCKDQLTNRPIQKLVLTKITSAVPELPEWDSKSNGAAYLSALWEECDRYEDVREEFAQTFKNAGVQVHRLSMGHESALEHHIHHHIEGATFERKRSRAALSTGATVELEQGLNRKS